MSVPMRRSLTLLFATIYQHKHPAQLLASCQQAGLEVALLNTDMIVGELQIHAAANRALFAQRHNQMKTKSLPTELIYFMSAAKNIGGALKTFGIMPSSEKMFVAIFDATEAQIQTLRTVIDGKFDYALKFDHFVPNLVHKFYGISEAELACNSLLSLIVTRIAVHDL